MCRGGAQAPDRRPLLDADAAIARIENSDPETKIERAESEFNGHLRSLAASADAADHKTAAARWLALVDEAIALPHRSFHGALGGAPPQPIGTLYTALLALPAPPAWPEIKRLVDERPPSRDRTVLQLLCARLLGDDREVIRLCREVEKQIPSGSDLRDMGNPTSDIRLAAMARLGTLGDAQVDEWIESSNQGNGRFVYIGDLFSEAAARAAILRELESTDPNHYVSFGNLRTIRLAQQVALAHLGEISKPPWSLASGWDSLPFIRRLVDHYGVASLTPPQGWVGEAAGIYVRWLLLNGKVDLAAKLVQTQYGVPQVEPRDWGKTPPDLEHTISAVQKLAPKANLRELYVSAARAAGRVGDAIAYLEAAVRSSSTPHDDRLRALYELIGLHTRIGDLKAVDGDCRLADEIRLSPQDWDPAAGVLSTGMAIGDRHLLEFGLAHSLRQTSTYVEPKVIQALMDRSEFSRLEAVELQAFRLSRANPGLGDYAGQMGPVLCEIYFRTNRPKDLLAILEKFPYWDQPDLSHVANGYGWDDAFDPESQSVQFYAAWALSRTGQTPLAVRILRRYLLLNGGTGAEYELFNSLGGAAALPAYEEQARMRPLSPLPLLWKGDLLFRLHRNREAETCVREAAALDPSAGRRSYRRKLNSLMAAILRAKGDRGGARRCEDLVRAIDLEIRAKVLWQAGLLSRVDPVLAQAAAICPRDAILQEDFADLLDAEDRFPQADAHRMTAIECLPSAMGRSTDNQDLTKIVPYAFAQSESGRKALDRLVRQNLKDPRVYFARGTALGWAGRYKEAVADFRKAIALDPTDAPAWDGLVSYLLPGIANPSQAQEAALRAIRFDLFQQPYVETGALASVSNLGAAYRALRNRLEQFPVVEDDSLFPLHTDQPERQAVDWPSFNRNLRSGRLVGAVIRNVSDVREIADLYHPTRFPFE